MDEAGGVILRLEDESLQGRLLHSIPDALVRQNGNVCSPSTAALSSSPVRKMYETLRLLEQQRSSFQRHFLLLASGDFFLKISGNTQ
mmetsp:Transcript_12714/g.18373  ORF Transcript_12714/g.18373 Transcript_12714/m.18373 type:complete len:87 (+) Transcript_12714:111-371(+)